MFAVFSILSAKAEIRSMQNKNKRLSDELNDIFQNAEAVPLKPWDPMGALAK